MKFIVKVENQTYVVEVGDLHARPVIAVIDGEPYEVWLESKTNATADNAATSRVTPVASQPTSITKASTTAPKSNAKAIYAPIPGLIISIAVQPGSQVEYGQDLCVLEAMKMKNTIRAARAGTIAAVHVSIGQHVKHHAVLMEYTD